MDLGIRGRSAIVCASSQGLGKGCANALAEAGVALVINGRHEALLEQTAQEIRQSWGVSVTPVLADVSTAAGQAALLKACPNPDILINNRLTVLADYDKQPEPYVGDFDTPEQRIGAFQTSRAWESCMSIVKTEEGGGWSYRPDGTVRSYQECMTALLS